MLFDIAEFQIPAEVTEADPFDYRTFTPGHDGLRKLAWVLRHLPDVLPGYRYEHSHYANECGTAGCAYGVCQVLWPQTFPRDQRFGGDKPARADAAFGEDAYDSFFSLRAFAYTYPVTPLDVADAIDSYLAQSRAPETGGGR